MVHGQCQKYMETPNTKIGQNLIGLSLDSKHPFHNRRQRSGKGIVKSEKGGGVLPENIRSHH